MIGFDDIPEASYFTPPLTTVRQDFGELGRRGLELLVTQIEDDHRPTGRSLVATELIVRGSTTVPAR